MKMKKLLLLPLFMIAIVVTQSMAQQRKIDSLKNLLQSQSEDSFKVKTLISLSHLCPREQSDSAIHYLHEALSLSKKIKFLKGELNSYKNLGGVFYFNFDSAYYYFRMEAIAAKQAKDSFSLGNSFYDLAYTLIAGTNLSGRINEKTVDADAALYIDSAVAIFQAIGDTERWINSLTRQAEVFMYFNKMTDARATFKKARAVYESSSVKGEPVSNLYFTKGEFHFRNSEFDSALVCHQKSLAILEEGHSMPGVAYALGLIARDYGKLGKYNLAIESAERGLKIAEENKLMKEKLDAINALYQIYRAKKDYHTALIYYEQLFHLTDSLNASLAKESTSKFNLQLEAQKNKEKITVLLKDQQIQEQKSSRQRIILFSLLGGLLLIITLAYSIYKGKKRSDELLLNILPEEVAEELKEKGSADAKQFDDVTVMFTDFMGFTQISEKLSPTELVNEIHECFKAFDEIISKHNIEKIKTIGDSYMCAGGLPVMNKTNAEDIVRAAIEIQEYMNTPRSTDALSNGEVSPPNGGIFRGAVRIGIHTGPVVAGIVGVKKFAYDIWGDTVNIASRMESSGEAGKINISGSTYEIVKDKFKTKYRGEIETKGKGMMQMYFVEV